MQIATINSLRLHYAESGDPDGVPLVFANSLGTDFRIWDPLLPHLPAGLRLLRYDMRGHGLSDAPEGEYYMGDLVAEAAGLMDSLGIAGAVCAVAGAAGSNRPSAVAASSSVVNRCVKRGIGSSLGRQLCDQPQPAVGGCP